MSSRQDWLKERGRIIGVGASDSSALYGLHPYLSAFALFVALTEPKGMTDEEREEMTDQQEFGLAVEEPLARWYARKTGREVTMPAGTEGVYRLKDHPEVFCSPDRFTTTGVLQLKSGIHFDPSEPLPASWAIQEQHEMLVTGTRFASFAIWGTFRKRFYLNDLPINDAFCEIHLEKVGLFMSAVQTGQWSRFESELDGSASTTNALKTLFPRDNGTAIRLPAAATQWAEELERVDADLKDLGETKDKLRNMIRLEIGEHTFGVLESGQGFSNKLTNRAGYTVEPSEFRQLRKITKMPKGLLSQ